MKRFISIVFTCILITSQHDALMSQETTEVDTMVQRQGENGFFLSWRSLLPVKPITYWYDVLSYIHIGYERKLGFLWLQLFGSAFKQAGRYQRDFLIEVAVATPYAITLWRDRMYMDIGPISSYTYHYEAPPPQFPNATGRIQHSLSIGVLANFRVRVWKGLMVTQNNDFGYGPQWTSDNEKVKGSFMAMRLLGIGVGYRF